MVVNILLEYRFTALCLLSKNKSKTTRTLKEKEEGEDKEKEKEELLSLLSSQAREKHRIKDSHNG